MGNDRSPYRRVPHITLLPAIEVSGIDLSQSLKVSGRGFFGATRRRAAQTIVAGQIAVSFVLVAGANLLMTSVLHLGAEQLGFDPLGVISIRANLPASSGLLQLRPVTFRYKKPYEDGSKPLDYGLIAEEVADVYPDLVTKDADGNIQSVQYQKLTPMLLNELQKLRARVAALETALAGKDNSVVDR
jgi:Chaperone of endosialidase